MPNTSAPNELYTTRTLFTLGGGSAAVWLFTVVLEWIFELDLRVHYKWVGLGVALVLSYIGAVRLSKLNLHLGTVAFFNGLLIYVTSVGFEALNQGVNNKRDPADEATLIPFITNKPWWPAITLVDSIKTLKTEVIVANTKRESLESENRILIDSGKFLKVSKTSGTKSGIEEITKCLNSNRKLLDEIEALKAQIKTVHDQYPADLGKNTQKVSGLLKNVRGLNLGLLNNLNDYLNAGNLKPKEQLEASRNINEKINELRIQIDEYNSRIDQLISEFK